MEAADHIAVLNTGSSSIKFSLFGGAGLAPVLKGRIENLYGAAARLSVTDAGGALVHGQAWHDAAPGQESGMRALLDFLKDWLGQRRLRAVGHRIVHGGTRYAGPQLLDRAILAELEKLVPLAPLHLPHNLGAVRAAMAMAPDVP